MKCLLLTQYEHNGWMDGVYYNNYKNQIHSKALRHNINFLKILYTTLTYQ